MGNNALVGALWKEWVGPGLAPEAWGYWWVCVPIVVVGAPFGAWFIRHHSRQMIANLLIFFVVVQYVAAILIIPRTPALFAFSAAVTLAGAGLFGLISRSGRRRVFTLTPRMRSWTDPALERP